MSLTIDANKVPHNCIHHPPWVGDNHVCYCGIKSDHTAEELAIWLKDEWQAWRNNWE